MNAEITYHGGRMRNESAVARRTSVPASLLYQTKSKSGIELLPRCFYQNVSVNVAKDLPATEPLRRFGNFTPVHVNLQISGSSRLVPEFSTGEDEERPKGVLPTFVPSSSSLPMIRSPRLLRCPQAHVKGCSTIGHCLATEIY